MYIIAEGPVGMYLIDQHAAHHRVLFHQMLQAYETDRPLEQRTVNPHTVELALTSAKFIENNLEHFKLLGIDLEAFGPGTFIVRSLPVMINDSDPADVILKLMDVLQNPQLSSDTEDAQKLIIALSGSAAVRAGQVLSADEMQQIVRQLERTPSPHTDPYGRPTLLHMTSDQLAREFGRR
jgi:DNA mismatch repair protein MutL